MSTKKHKPETTEILDKRRAAWGAYERGQVRAAGSLFLGTITTLLLTISHRDRYSFGLDQCYFAILP
jgi:hypothetical protein